MSRQTATQTRQRKSPGIPIANALLQRKCACGGAGSLSGECEECSKDQVQAKSQSSNSGLQNNCWVPPIVYEVLRSPGQPLDIETRAFMEPRFGHDFSNVRVHTDGKAADSARSVHALAYTAGTHVIFGGGRYAVSTPAGQALLAHELAHVVQQSQASGALSPEDAAETAANSAATAADQSSLPPMGRVQPNTLQRQRTATPPVESESAASLDEASRVTHAAERARRNLNDQTLITIYGSEIVYGLVRLFLSDYSDRLSGVGYEDGLRYPRIEVSKGGSISITVGRRFVLATEEKTLEARALELGTAIFAKAPRPRGAQRGLLEAMATDSQRAPVAKISFDEALKEGADVLHAAGFGLVCGTESGPDPSDHYDARDWKEKEGRREVLVAKIEPWVAFSNFMGNLRESVPAPGGGTTKWAFDCFGFVIVNRLYAHWRTLTRSEFNSRYSPLEMGINARLNVEWEKPIEALRPGEKPFISTGEVKPNVRGEFVEERIPVKQTWDQILESAPIGSQVTWGNQDAKDKCRAKPDLPFCAFTYENTTKVGPNQYSAHPFGIKSREFIEDEMAKAVLEAENRPTSAAAKKAYIKRFVFIAGVRLPKKQAQQSTMST